MSFSWSHYLELAFHLAGVQGIKPNDEASSRSAISRAYFSVYCQARNHLRRVDGAKIPSSSRAHGVVAGKFRKSTDMTRKKIASKLDRLRDDRNKADYDDKVHGLAKLVQKSLADAKNVAGLLSGL